MLRNCDAFGIQAAHFASGQGEQLKPCQVGRRSSASAHRWLDYQFWPATTYLKSLKEAAIPFCISEKR